MKKLQSVLVILFLALVFFARGKTSYAQVVINEFSSSTDNDDWIEIYAYEDIDLVNYRLTHTKSDGSEGEINIPTPTNIGPNSVNGRYKVINVNNYLGNAGDRLKLYLIGDNTAKSDIAYGNQGGVCSPSLSGSIARIPDGGNTVDRLSVSTKGASNGESVTDPCPSPTPVPTNAPTNIPAPTNTPSPTNTTAPTSTKKPTVSPTKKPTPTPVDNTALNEKLKTEADLSQFRYDQEENEDKKTAREVLGSSSDVNKENISPFAYVLFGLGIIFIGVSVFFFVKNKKERSE